MIVGRQNQGALIVGQRSLGAVGRGLRKGRAHVDHAQTETSEGVEVDLHAHGRLLPATDENLPHALHLRHLLRQDRVRRIVDLGQRQRVRVQSHDEHGRVGGIDLAVGGATGQVGGQLAPGCIHRCLHIARGARDIAAQVELHGDAGGAQRTCRGHLGQTRDAAKATFERGGHRAGHGFGASAGQCGLNVDGRKINARQGRNGQIEVGRQARQDERDGQQGCGDGSAQEGPGDVHAAGSPTGGWAAAVAVPGLFARPRWRRRSMAR